MSDSTKIPLETEITKAIMKRLRDMGVLYLFKSAGNAYQRSGLPDIIGIVPDGPGRGLFFGMEVKRPKIGRATAIQLKTLRDINAAGGYAVIVHSPDEAQEALEEAMHGKQVDNQ